MLLRRREGERTGGALAASLVLHAAALGAMAAFSGPPRPPAEKVIAVDIVSPPPNVAGEKMAEPPATQEPAPAAQPEPPAAEPAPPAPEPPAPTPPTPPTPRPEPRREPPKEPEKAREPRREPERPAQRPPAQTPPRAQTPAQRPRTEPERPKSSTPAQGTQANRTEGQGTRTGPATGTNARPDAAGGEGITVRTDGDPCPVQGYCENVTRQVNRFFRPPAESAGATGEVCFRIQRDGSVTDIETRRVRGGAAFRLALLESAEAAGTRRAFGTLPAAFDPARWRWCVELSPR